MLFAREDVADLSTDEGRLPEGRDRRDGGVHPDHPRKRASSRRWKRARTALRDRRLAALAHYVLSLRRHGLGPWLFREHPEKEARR
jgi:hypothetical protein